jgi:hypothetical protein
VFGLFFHPRRSDSGRAVAVRVMPGQHCAQTTDAPPAVVVSKSLPDPQTELNRAPGSIGNVTSDTSHNSTPLSTRSRP